MLDNRVMHMAPGEALLEVPIGEMIQRLGIGIAEAQIRLDQMAVRVAAMLSEARVDFRDAQGNTSTKSLLELGFTPNFYHFTETELEVRLTLSMKVEEGFHFGMSGNVGNDAGSIGQATAGAAGSNAQGGGAPGNGGGSSAASSNNDRRAVLFGAAINVDYHRKYSFEMSGSSLIRTKMIAVPPPGPFLEALREQARAGGTVAAGGAGAGGAAGGGGALGSGAGSGAADAGNPAAGPGSGNSGAAGNASDGNAGAAGAAQPASP